MEKVDLKKIKELVEKKNKIEQEIQEIYSKHYKKYEENKELVKDDNPYSRLYALKKMGIVKNFEEISNKTILIVGVGGVGSVLSEMLVRIGVGKLILYDYDTVELANMNRLFYTPDQVGFTKVEAAKMTLKKINSKIQIQIHHCNITIEENYKNLLKEISTGGIKKNKVDLIISCVDNYAARMTINTACNKLKQTWFESGVSEDALSCHFQIMIPGETACFACIPPLAFIEKTENQIKREGVCSASLPTTMGMTAGLLAHTAMKFLLQFEDVKYYLQYNARSEFFSDGLFRPSPDCLDRICRGNQEFVRKEGIDSIEERRIIVRKKKKEIIVQKDEVDLEKWGIEVMEDDDFVREEVFVKEEDVKNSNLEDLMKQLKSS